MDTLAFIRYMVGLAQEQAEKSDPFCVTAVLTIHDAVELFLIQAREQPGVTMPATKDQSLIVHFQMELPTGGRLTHRDTIEKLLKFRVPFKHYATFTPQKEVQKIVTLVLQFFEDNTPRVFGLNFDDISLLDLVHDARAQAHLREAEKQHAAGDHVAAFGEIAISFEIIMDRFNSARHIAPQHRKHRFSSERDVASNFSLHSGGRLGRSTDTNPILKTMASLTDDVYEEVDALGTVVAILALKLDYARYLRFRKLTPHAWGYMVRGAENGREYEVIKGQTFVPKPETYQSCLNFIIELAISMEALLADA